MRYLLPRAGFVAVALLLASTSGCAAMRATRQPGKRDMAVLERGVPRSHVVAELGTPVYSSRATGQVVDTFRFVQGYTKTTKTARFLIHGTADFFTFGLWEIVGIPAEMAASGTEVQVEVRYDPDLQVDQVVVIKGEKAVHPPDMLAFLHLKPAKADPEKSTDPAQQQMASQTAAPSAGQSRLPSAQPPQATPVGGVAPSPATPPGAVVATGAQTVR